MQKTRVIAACALVLTAALAGQAAGQRGRGFGPPGGGPENGMNTRPPNAPDQKPAFAGQTRAPEQKLNVAFDVVTVAEGLVNPWGLAFLPDGKMLVTERPGRLRVVSADGKQMSEPVAGLPAVDARGQGGLLDVALDPAFATNQLIYWSYAEPRADGMNNTAVARGRFVDGAAPKVENVQVIFHQAPSLDSTLHFGGRLVFGRDGTLFITLGDRSITEGRMQAQRMDGLLGKIVRLNADGSIPKDNPFVGKEGVRPEIWSLGHRNMQAATLHPTTGELWEVEHGTRGGDELNIVAQGQGLRLADDRLRHRVPGRRRSPAASSRRKAWSSRATTGIRSSRRAAWCSTPARCFPAWQGSLFIGGLGSTNLVRLTLKGEQVVGEERLLQDLQPQRERIRDVRQGPDGALYLLTDNAKGRILKLVPKR